MEVAVVLLPLILLCPASAGQVCSAAVVAAQVAVTLLLALL